MKQYKLLISSPLSILFVFWVMKWEGIHKALCVLNEVWWLSLEKHFSDWVATELAAFFKKYHFYLKEWLADKLSLFKLQYLVDIFLKIKRTCHFKENNSVVVDNDKNKVFQQ